MTADPARSRFTRAQTLVFPCRQHPLLAAFLLPGVVKRALTTMQKKSMVSENAQRERNSIALHKATSNIGGLADALKRDLATLDRGAGHRCCAARLHRRPGTMAPRTPACLPGPARHGAGQGAKPPEVPTAPRTAAVHGVPGCVRRD